MSSFELNESLVCHNFHCKRLDSLFQFDVVVFDGAPEGKQKSNSARVIIHVDRMISQAPILRFEQNLIVYVAFLI